MSSKPIDPIVLLRDYAVKSKPIKLVDNNIVFGHIKIPITAPTAWISPFDDKQYSIGSLYFCLKNKTFDEKYLNDCAAYKVNFVSKMDMESTLEYFTGRVETSDYIKEEIRQSTLITKEKKDDEEQRQNSKDDIMDYVAKIEKRTTGRQEQMLSKASFMGVLALVPDYLMEKKRKQQDECLKKADELGINPVLTKRKKQLSFLEELQMLNVSKDSFTESIAHPILIVPSKCHPGNLNLGNISAFLTEGRYEETTSNDKLVDKVLVKRMINGINLTFEVRDSVKHCKHIDWKSMVGVFLSPDEQFEGWPKAESATSILLKVRGFYVHYSDTSVPKLLDKYNMKVLEVHRLKKYLNKSCMEAIWTEIESMLMKPRFRSTQKTYKL